MAITMAQINVVLKHYQQLYRTALLLGTSCSLFSLQAAELDIKPSLTASSYAFWLREQQQGDALDKGLAGLLSPMLAINSTSKHLTSALSLKNESVWYDDAQRSHKSLSSYNWRGAVSGYDSRLRFGLTANSAHRIRNSRAGVFSDIITGAENLSKTSSYGSSLDFSTLETADTYVRLGLNYRNLRSEAPELDDGVSDFENDAYGAMLSLGSADRQSVLFWQFSGSYDKTDRQVGQSFVAKQANASAGVPLYRNLSAIVRGSYDVNDGSRSFNNDFRSYGVGLEYKFGRASRINISRNKSVTSSVGAAEQDIRDTYTAAEVVLVPTRRTSLSYSLDRRYFGRTASIQGSYQLRFISARLSVTDNVQTLSRFEQITEDLGIFVCPDTAGQLSDCFRPPSSNYQLETGEAFRQLFNTELELNEEIVKRRSVAFAVGYARNRLALNMLLNRSDDNYVESARESERTTLSLQSSWQLSARSSLLFNIRHYGIDYGDDREDKNLALDGGLKYKLNNNADISALFRRVKRDSTLNDLDIEENRLWLSLTHRF